jgi:hypothetical protein
VQRADQNFRVEVSVNKKSFRRKKSNSAIFALNLGGTKTISAGVKPPAPRAETEEQTDILNHLPPEVNLA